MRNDMTLEETSDGIGVLNCLAWLAEKGEKKTYEDMIPETPTIQQVVERFGGVFWSTQKPLDTEILCWLNDNTPKPGSRNVVSRAWQMKEGSLVMATTHIWEFNDKSKNHIEGYTGTKMNLFISWAIDRSGNYAVEVSRLRKPKRVTDDFISQELVAAGWRTKEDFEVFLAMLKKAPDFIKNAGYEIKPNFSVIGGIHT